MKLHPRTLKVQMAAIDLEAAMLRIAQDRGITPIESLGILLQAAAVAHKYLLRVERHGDASKKADEA